MKTRDYCCCAIPLVNAGIYAVLVEQTALGIIVGALSVGTPSIVGAVTPSFAPWILGIIAFVAAGIQFLGFIGVAREKPGVYKSYITFHGIVTSAGFSVAVAWIILSASRHSTAQSKCIVDFFTDGNNTGSSEGETLCNIFPWVDVGIMGALWVILAAVHTYFFFVLSSYGKGQRRDHDQYDRAYDPTQPLTAENIPLDSRNDPWDARPSEDYLGGNRNGQEYKHLRQESASDVLNQPYLEPKDSLSTKEYSYSAYEPGGGYRPQYPADAYTQKPTTTPTYTNYSDAYASDSIEPPHKMQAHPAEGSFGRKTPRYGE